ncbi:DNA-binding IclR family transcriptional regulator [Kitasatospora sp. MAA19]|uniref:helix-turn-helix transcriptional regulator n=1 Tax=unclassified Kitasatospora TaxID=2633591 RepID=UPI002473DF58|nr:winged helix-turn-helix domain-containing protein [Kitasatospora sp. MAA19]MDH6706663.1 DNA-binding IclR family transcriptional regulator [Kitasatospora sp. MAA19]
METTSDTSTNEGRTRWTFLTNHARVLSLLARDPGVRLRDVAAACGLTERAVQGIVADLEAEGYLTRSREGRRNRYRIAPEARLRHPVEARHTIGALLALLSEEADPEQLDSSAGAAGEDEGGRFALQR